MDSARSVGRVAETIFLVLEKWDPERLGTILDDGTEISSWADMPDELRSPFLNAARAVLADCLSDTSPRRRGSSSEGHS